MYPYLLHHFLEKTAASHPDKAAVVIKDDSISYDSLNRQSNRLASALMELGVKKGERVGFVLSKSIEAVVTLFAILKAGAIYVPIDPLAPSERVKYIVGNCGIAILLTSRKNLDKITGYGEKDFPLRKIVLTDAAIENFGEPDPEVSVFSFAELLPRQGDTNPSIHISDVNPAYILHTSGSTGRPKGVVISHLNAMTFVNMAADFFAADSSDRFCSQAPFHFDLSVFDIYVAVKCGATVVLFPEYLALFPQKLVDYIQEQRVTVWNSVSSVLILIANYDHLQRCDFTNLKHVIFSGEFLPTKYLRKLQNHMANAQFYNLYGQTEANSSMYYRVEDIPDDDAWKVPIGKPFDNFEVFAVKDNGEVVGQQDETGMLYVKSSTVAIEYWRDKEKTDDVFVRDPRSEFPASRVYKTGDLVRIDSEGNYILIGRNDRVVKSRGYRIELDEIEGALNNHPSVHQAVVINVPNELIGNNIAAFVSPVEGMELEAAELNYYCSRLLPRYMIPELIEIRASLPTTPNGKIDRQELKNEVLSKLKQSESSV